MPNTYADIWSILQRFHLPKLAKNNAEKVTLVYFINYNRGCFESFSEQNQAPVHANNNLNEWSSCRI